MSIINDIDKDAENRMNKSVEALRSEFCKMRTGRANPGLLEHIQVSYYGNKVPLNQVASISVSDARTLTVTPWEKSMVAEIEKAIMQSDLGLNPATAGQTIRVPLPPLTEERRKEMIKVLRSEAENARVSVRNIRRDANVQIKELLKDKEISEDDEHRFEDVIQKLTNKHIAQIDSLLEEKEKGLLEF